MTGAGKIFHSGKASGGGDYGGGDMPWSWTEPYHFCDNKWNQRVQSPAGQGWPYGPGPQVTGTGCVQSPKCLACLMNKSDLGNAHAWASGDCPDECYTDGRVAAQAIAELEYKAQHPDQPFLLAVGFKRPVSALFEPHLLTYEKHLGFYAPQWAFDLYPEESIKIAEHRTPPKGKSDRLLL